MELLNLNSGTKGALVFINRNGGWIVLIILMGQDDRQSKLKFLYLRQLYLKCSLNDNQETECFSYLV